MEDVYPPLSPAGEGKPQTALIPPPACGGVRGGLPFYALFNNPPELPRKQGGNGIPAMLHGGVYSFHGAVRICYSLIFGYPIKVYGHWVYKG